MIFGIDIASYQGDPDFDRVKSSGLSVVFTKLTEGYRDAQGDGYVNPHAARTRTECHRLGLGLGLYHFADGGDPVAEADHFLVELGTLAAGDVLALDWETNVQGGGDPVAWCLTWLRHVQQVTGVAPLLYLNESLLGAHDWAPVVAGGFGLWLAAYDYQPTVIPPSGVWPVLAVKQYSNRGVVAGVAGPVDLDTFQGTLAQFRAYGYQATTPAPVVAPPVVHPPAPQPGPAPAQPWDRLPALAYGQTSDAVLRLEQFLVRVFPSYCQWTPTRFYGDLTAAGLAEFQRRSGITGGDGRNVGPQTKRALWAAGFRG